MSTESGWNVVVAIMHSCRVAGLNETLQFLLKSYSMAVKIIYEQSIF
jgi:hypothetical protein